MASLFEQYFEARGEFVELDLSLKRIDEAALSFRPSDDTRVIHVAGTNGKGSTSLFISQLLQSQGFSTVLFTSPHIERIQERIRFNGDIVSEQLFDELFIKAKPYIERHHLSYFETLFLMALILNFEKKCDFLVLETGLGGRFDATNTSSIERKTPVITSISQDHKHILGRKIEDIAKEKAAIANGCNPVFIAHNPDFIIDIFRRELHDADLRLVKLDRLDEARMIYPDPYSYNYLNAHNVAEYVLGKTLPFMHLALPPCRQEHIGRVLLDGAHNPSGLLTLLGSFTEKTMPKVAVLSSTLDRDLRKHCRLVASKIPEIILTSIPDMDRSVNEDILRTMPYRYFILPSEALEYALSRTDSDVLITGSLYLCAFMRKKLL